MIDVQPFRASDNGVHLSIFLTAGYPDLETCGAVLDILATHPAVAFVELGMPFSDPLADGPTIQRASEVALAQGTTLDDVFALASRFRSACAKPLMLMGYCNPVYRRGVETFAAEAQSAGATGLILPDLPYESHHRDFKPGLEAAGLSMAFLVSPTSTPDSVSEAFDTSSAFVYGVANVGLTGDAQSMDRNAFFSELQHHREQCPLVAGFGLSTPADVASLAGLADGAIIGSAFLRAIAHAEGDPAHPDATVQRALDFLAPFLPPS
jgi:tryptophan synthase alpha chain